MTSIAESRLQTATVLAALALSALVSPFSAAASGLAASLLLLARRRTRADPFADEFIQRDVERREGVYALGYEDDGAPLKMSPGEMRHHVLVSQKACLGRHEYLLALAEEMIANGTGLIYISPVFDVGLPARIHAAAASLGREDDVIFVTAGWQKLPGRENAFDYFEAAKGSEIAKTVLDLIDWHAEVGDQWKTKITELATVVVEARVWLRDVAGEPFDVDVLREALSLDRIVALAQESLGDQLPDAIKGRLQLYLDAIPGYNPERGTQQSRDVLEYHGYIQMWVGKSLHDLSDSGIMNASTSRIDLDEVLSNRRILVVMLDRGSHNPHAVKAVGSAFLSMLRHRLSASVREFVSPPDVALPKGGPTFPIILDGIEAYASGDIRRLALDASVLGCSIIYGSDDRSVSGVADPAVRADIAS
ncbi:MAG: hypothetical protein K2X38_18440, partial [Gemmataceae bacterium]|nr:hypothetical protein [Gemmataceae bacterium]